MIVGCIKCKIQFESITGMKRVCKKCQHDNLLATKKVYRDKMRIIA